MRLNLSLEGPETRTLTFLVLQSAAGNVCSKIFVHTHITITRLSSKQLPPSSPGLAFVLSGQNLRESPRQLTTAQLILPNSPVGAFQTGHDKILCESLRNMKCACLEKSAIFNIQLGGRSMLVRNQARHNQFCHVKENSCTSCKSKRTLMVRKCRCLISVSCCICLLAATQMYT